MELRKRGCSLWRGAMDKNIYVNSYVVADEVTGPPVTGGDPIKALRGEMWNRNIFLAHQNPAPILIYSASHKKLGD